MSTDTFEPTEEPTGEEPTDETDAYRSSATWKARFNRVRVLLGT